jgi:hypothetical protein
MAPVPPVLVPRRSSNVALWSTMWPRRRRYPHIRSAGTMLRTVGYLSLLCGVFIALLIGLSIVGLKG